MIRPSDYLHSKASLSRIPLAGTFELSPVCNFSCRMCYVRKTPEQIRAEGKQLRTWQDWVTLGERCRDEGMLYLLLTGGEPFLYPGFRELYTALHEMGLLLSINTNGTLIDEETVAWLKDMAPQRVNVTLYGASRETYERVCCNASGFDRAVHALKLLKEAGIPTVINSSMIPENEKDLEKIVEIGKSLEIKVRIATYMFPPVRRGKEQADSRFDPETSAKVFMRRVQCTLDDVRYEKLLDQYADKPEAQSADDWGNSEEAMRCRAGRSSFWVAWDGSMTACGMMDFPISVYPFDEDFSLCWNTLTDRVRSTTVLKGCAGCRYRELCKPCAAMMHAETGDVNKKAPYLCALAEHVTAMIHAEAAKNGRIKQE